MKRLLWRSVAQFGLLSMAALICLLHGAAQQTLGSVNGTVVDSSGAAVPSATVTVSNASINFSATTKTKETGFFQIFNLPVGTYVVKVGHAGFATTEIKGIQIHEASARTVNPTLKLGQVDRKSTRLNS